MAKFVESFGNPDGQLDLSALFCPNPRCGSPSVKILRYPRSGTWMHAIGSALCLDCGAKFGVREVAPPEPAPRKEADW